MLLFLLWDDLLGFYCSHFQLLSQCSFVFSKWKQAVLAEFRWLAWPFLWLEKLSVIHGSIITLSPPYSHYIFWLHGNVMDYYSKFINHIAFTIMLLTLQKLLNYLQSVQWNAENTSIQFFYKHISVQSLVFFGFCHFCSCSMTLSVSPKWLPLCFMSVSFISTSVAFCVHAGIFLGCGASDLSGTL